MSTDPPPHGARSGGASFTGGRVFALWPAGAGLAVLAVLWLGPLPEWSRRAFSPHMILHLGVTVVAAPLIARGLIRAGIRTDADRRPILIALLFSATEMAVVWGWHAPALHEAAALFDSAFVAQQASFLAAGLFVWLGAFGGRSRAAYAGGLLVMLLTFMHMSMLGALLVLAPDLLYPPALCLGAFGLEPLDDQRFGGVLMAVGGGAPFLAGGLVLVYRLVSGWSEAGREPLVGPRRMRLR